MVNCIVKVDDWVLDEGKYKVNIQLDNLIDDNIIITFDTDSKEELDEISNLISTEGKLKTITICTLVANELPKKDISLNIDSLSNMPGRLETILNSEGEEIVTYVEDNE